MERECGIRFYEASRFVDQCPECGAAATPVDFEEDPRPEEILAVPGRPGRPEPVHLAHAREMARKVLREHGITKPPVPVRAIARRVGLDVAEMKTLGSLSARLVDNRIEVVSSEPEVRKRFSIAHELGHHFLGSTHESTPTSESEANAFAGELLVPGPFLHALVGAGATEEELRKRFAVSRDVIEIAAANHRLRDRLT